MYFVFRWLSNHHRLVPWRSITEEPNLTRQKTWNSSSWSCTKKSLKLTIKLEPFKHLGNKNHSFQWNNPPPPLWNNNFKIYEHLGVPKPMVCNWNHDFSCQKRKKVMQIMAGNDTGIVPAHEDLCGRGISGERRLIHTTGKQLMRPWPQPCWVTHSTATAEIVLIRALYKIDNTVKFRN